MNLRWMAALAALLLAATAGAEGTPQGKELEEKKERVSYSIGMDIGRNLKQQPFEVDPDLLAQGVRDAFAGGKTLLTPEEARQTLADLQKELMEKQQEQVRQIMEKNRKEGVLLKDPKFLPAGDLVLGRLEPFEPPEQAVYPVIKDPSRLDIGTSLCKLGYPFSRIEATFNESTQSFEFSPGTAHPTRFPVEGIYTRDLRAGRSRDGKYEIKFLETSSPGILGQSGGPIFDVKSSLWGVQSRTDMYPLGPATEDGPGKERREEPAYFSVGVGIHPELLIGFLLDNDIPFTLSDY